MASLSPTLEECNKDKYLKLLCTAVAKASLIVTFHFKGLRYQRKDREMWPGEIFIYLVGIDHPTDYFELKAAGQYILLVRAKYPKQSV